LSDYFLAPPTKETEAMSRWHIDRHAEREHERLLADREAGRITRDEYNREAREIDREARDAVEAEIFWRQQEIEEEYYGY
jgi:hypothetical protein